MVCEKLVMGDGYVILFLNIAFSWVSLKYKNNRQQWRPLSPIYKMTPSKLHGSSVICCATWREELFARYMFPSQIQYLTDSNNVAIHALHSSSSVIVEFV